MIFLGKEVLNGRKPMVVAEISGNHDGDFSRAIRLIDAAKEAGADAVKIQCYNADSLTLNNGYVIGSGTPWKGETLYELYKQAGTPFDWIPALFDHAKKIGIPIFSSVYDLEGLRILELHKCPAYKIASYEANDPEFIKAVSDTGKPVVISTGTLSEQELHRALVAATSLWNENRLIVLHCVSKYPTYVEELQLGSMTNLIRQFSFPIGFSCHSDDIVAPCLAASHGAAMIEVHLALDIKEYQADYEFSFLPDQLSYMIELVNASHESTWLKHGLEDDAAKFKRSLYVVKEIHAGETFTREHLRSYRPNLGCEPYLLPNIVGRKANRHIEVNKPMKMEYVE